MVLNINKVCVENLRYLRVKLKDKDIKLKIFKNKIVKHAIKNTMLQEISSSLVGQTALLWDDNINNSLVAARIIYDVKKHIETLEPVCGFYNGRKIDNDYIEYLSKIPSMNTLRSKIISLLSGTLKRIVISIRYHLFAIVNILKPCKSNKKKKRKMIKWKKKRNKKILIKQIKKCNRLSIEIKDLKTNRNNLLQTQR
jgi:large subunit ribosomal protein L10